MRKSDIVKRIAAEAFVTPLAAETAIDILLSEIGEALARGEKVPLRLTGQVCAAQVEVRSHSAKWSRGRVSHRQDTPIESGPQPIVTAQSRYHGRMPIVLPLSATRRSNLGNPE